MIGQCPNCGSPNQYGLCPACKAQMEILTQRTGEQIDNFQMHREIEFKLAKDYLHGRKI